jgi:hypothetical protein
MFPLDHALRYLPRELVLLAIVHDIHRYIVGQDIQVPYLSILV